VEYSVGFPTKNHAATSAITKLPERAWTPALAADRRTMTRIPVGQRDRSNKTGEFGDVSAVADLTCRPRT
jgi:hypothetical protein